LAPTSPSQLSRSSPRPPLALTAWCTFLAPEQDYPGPGRRPGDSKDWTVQDCPGRRNPLPRGFPARDAPVTGPCSPPYRGCARLCGGMTPAGYQRGALRARSVRSWPWRAGRLVSVSGARSSSRGVRCGGRSATASDGTNASTTARCWWVACSPERAQGHRSLHRRHRAAEFEEFLAELDNQVPADLQVHLILDNYAPHKTPDIKKWLLGASTVPLALHADQRVLAEPGRAAVRRTHTEEAQTPCPPLRPGPRTPHQVLARRLERTPQTLHPDEDRRRGPRNL
jgi:hypothetical protein